VIYAHDDDKTASESLLIVYIGAVYQVIQLVTFQVRHHQHGEKSQLRGRSNKFVSSYATIENWAIHLVARSTCQCTARRCANYWRRSGQLQANHWRGLRSRLNYSSIYANLRAYY